MCIYNYKFSFGSKKFQVKIEAANTAEAYIKFKDFIVDTISISSLNTAENNQFITVNSLEELDTKACNGSIKAP
jgi:hypothetical protein